MNKPFKVLLVSLPWAKCDHVSLQLGILKSAIIQHGHTEIESRHYYKDILPYIGYKRYDDIQANNLGEFCSALLLFPEKKPQITEIIKGKIPSLSDTDLDLLEKNLRKFIEDVSRDILSHEYALIAFTTSLVQTVFSILVSRLVKENRPGVKICMGGASLIDDMAWNLLRSEPSIDVIVEGEGETTFTSLIDALKTGGDLKNIEGLYYRTADETLVSTNKRPLNNDLQSLPIPEVDDYFKFSLPNSKEYKLYPKICIEASRGCFWGECSFCNLNGQWRKTYRDKDDEQIIKELEQLSEKYSIHQFVFCDSNVSNKRSLFRKIAALNKDFFFYAEVSGHCSYEQLKEMRQAGVKNIQIGIEAFSQTLLTEMNKGISVMRNVELLQWCAELEIELYYNVIRGFPTETKKEIDQTLETMNFVKYFQPPLLCPYYLSYRSTVYENQSAYNVKSYKLPPSIQNAYPEQVMNNIGPLLLSVVGYIPEVNKNENADWTPVAKFVKQWENSFQRNARKPSITYHDMKTFLIIEDSFELQKRFIKLTGLQRALYLYCNKKAVRIDTLEQIASNKPATLKAAINKLRELGLLYLLENYCFSIGVRAK